jgi:hypothetical protein
VTAPSVSLGAAVNDREVLATCLAHSPDVAARRMSLATYEGCRSAAEAYNRALDGSAADVVLLVHQDVYLPAGFHDHLLAQLEALAAADPDWAVAGVIGIDPEGVVRGQTWSSGIGALVGEPVDGPVEVVTLDEVFLAVRRASGVRFDETMPGFHLYAADAVQAARARGQRSYVLPLPLVHHSKPVVRLDAGYRRAYRFMQRKWRAALPLPNLVCPIEATGLALLRRDLRLRWRNRGRTLRAAPTEDPAAIARRLGMEGRRS